MGVPEMVVWTSQWVSLMSILASGYIVLVCLEPGKVRRVGIGWLR